MPLLGWKSVFWIGYPQKRDSSKCFAWTIFLLGPIVMTILVAITYAGTAYAYFPLVSRDFNGTIQLWYERFAPPNAAWVPASRFCEASVIKFDECFYPSSRT